MRRPLAVFATLAAFCLSAAPSWADTLRLLPPEVTFTDATASQTLLLIREADGTATADLTGEAAFASSAPAVVVVGPDGELRPVGDGEATVTATVGGESAVAKIRVSGMATPPARNFVEHVLPVLTRSGCNTGACHGALAGKGGLKLSLRGYDPESDHFVLTRQALGRRVNTAEPDRSLTLRKATREVRHGGGTRLVEGSPEYEAIHAWIAEGAPGPSAGDATVERLELFPASARLSEGDRMRVLVRAWYSDGRSADVTALARFGSSEELVANVDEEGTVTVVGHGRAAVTVGFDSHVATVPVVSPFPGGLDPADFDRLSPSNFIDEKVLAQLRELNLPPSEGCSDREFIRRASLDACGVLPTPEEVDAFVADARPDKRIRLVDRLLERDEFVDYWTYQWSDLLLVSTRNLPEPAMWAFHRWVRRNVADNRPWDEFARELLTATGSTLSHGAGNYFVLHTDVADLTESTAVTFLGMSITCARCHNHPLEKWTQDQYWGLANLFSRVTMKNGTRAGDVSIQPSAGGDILHPRSGVAVPPTPLDGEPMPPDAEGDRRAYFADWLTAPENPYFARAIVNRVWANYMGRGLVDPVDDLRQTNPPSNAALFDALAEDFVANGHDLKRLMRLILNSGTYQRSAVPTEANRTDDRFHSRYLIRRLSAELVLDAYSQVTGVPTPFSEVYTGVENDRKKTENYPPGTRALQLPDTRVASQFLDAFGRPDRELVCSCEREGDSSVGQALHLNNGATLNAKLGASGGRIDAWLKDGVSDAEAVRRLFSLALSRPPTESESAEFAAVLAGTDGDDRRAALEDVFWAVLTSKEFLFNH